MDKEKYQDLISQGKLLMTRDRYEEALALFRQALEENPRGFEGYLAEGNALACLQRFPEAKEAFEKACVLEPTSGEAVFSVGNVCFLADDPLGAVEHYNRAEELGYRTVDMYQIMAEIFSRAEDYTQAIRCTNRGIELAPLNGELRLQKATLQMAMGKFHEALETLDAFAAIFPDAYEAYSVRARVLIGLGRHAAAEKLLDEGMERFPADPGLHLEKLRFLVEQNRPDEALRFAETLRGGPAEIPEKELLMNEALACAAKSDVQGVVTRLETCLQLPDGTDAGVLFLLMNAYMQTQTYEKLANVAQALREREDATKAMRYAGGFYHLFALKMLGRKAEADAGMKALASELRGQTIDDPAAVELYALRLLCHLELGEYDKAEQLADYLAAVYPDNPEVSGYRKVIAERRALDAAKC